MKRYSGSPRLYSVIKYGSEDTPRMFATQAAALRFMFPPSNPDQGDFWVNGQPSQAKYNLWKHLNRDVLEPKYRTNSFYGFVVTQSPAPII